MKETGEGAGWKAESCTFLSTSYRHATHLLRARTSQALSLRSCDSSSSPGTSLHTSCGPPNPAQAHHSVKRPAAVNQKVGGGKIIREVQSSKKEPARPPPSSFKEINQQKCNDRPQQTCQGHLRMKNILLLIKLSAIAE